MVVHAPLSAPARLIASSWRPPAAWSCALEDCEVLQVPRGERLLRGFPRRRGLGDLGGGVLAHGRLVADDDRAAPVVQLRAPRAPGHRWPGPVSNCPRVVAAPVVLAHRTVPPDARLRIHASDADTADQVPAAQPACTGTTTGDTAPATTGNPAAANTFVPAPA